MTTLNLSLPDPMKEFLEAQAEKEGYGSVGDYVRSIIEDVQRREAKRALETKLREGLASPLAPMTDADWASLRGMIRGRSPELDGEGLDGS